MFFVTLTFLIVSVFAADLDMNLKHDLKDYILPPVFGNFNLSSLSSAASCGAAMASYSSVTAYSNGAYQGTGKFINVC